jgi:hypothetical protein
MSRVEMKCMTYAGPEPMDKACCWDKSKKDYANVDRPIHR